MASEWNIKQWRVLKPFWWTIFPTLDSRENLKIQIADLKQLPKENQNGYVPYYFKVEFNFGTIGKAMTDKMTVKVVGN